MENQDNKPAPTHQEVLSVKGLLNSEGVKKKFTELMGKEAQGFITNVLQVATNNKLLAKADPHSIYNAAATAAILKLSINPNLGQAYIVPYGDKAQFQLGWRGLVQLAMRTGQYLKLNVVEVYENQFTSWNTLTEELVGKFDIEGEGKIVGYAAYFELINGMKKTVYWTKSKVEAHGKKYSKSYNNGPWKDLFDEMAKKTVLKNMLSKWGILSIEMQKAFVVDQAVIKDDEANEVEYTDATEVNQIEPTKDEKEAERMIGLIHATKTLTALNKLKADNAELFAGNATIEDAFDNKKSELL